MVEGKNEVHHNTFPSRVVNILHTELSQCLNATLARLWSRQTRFCESHDIQIRSSYRILRSIDESMNFSVQTEFQNFEETARWTSGCDSLANMSEAYSILSKVCFHLSLGQPHAKW